MTERNLTAAAYSGAVGQSACSKPSSVEVVSLLEERIARRGSSMSRTELVRLLDPLLSVARDKSVAVRIPGVGACVGDT